jgi:hypothetical protein
MSKQERFALKGEDMREDFELSSYVAQSLVQELSRSLDKHTDSQKAAEARQNGEFPYFVPQINSISNNFAQLPLPQPQTMVHHKPDINHRDDTIILFYTRLYFL